MKDRYSTPFPMCGGKPGKQKPAPFFPAQVDKEVL